MIEIGFLKKIELIRNLLSVEVEKTLDTTNNVVNVESSDDEIQNIEYIKVVKDDKTEVNIDIDSFKEIVGVKKIEDVFLLNELNRIDLKLDSMKISNILYEDDKVKSIIYDGDNNSNIFNRVVYEYDSNGNLTKIYYYYNSISLEDKKAEKSCSYDSNGNLISVSYKEY